MEFSDVLPPGVDAFDDESWQTTEKYVGNKSQNNEKMLESVVPPSFIEMTIDKPEIDESEFKKETKDKKVNKDKKRRKKEKEKEKEKDVDGKKSKKHKREKSDRDVSQEKVKHEEHEEKTNFNPIELHSEFDVFSKNKPLITEVIKTTENDRNLTPPLNTITKSDSVLDLYDNIDLDIFGDASLNQTDDFLTLPEPSKWELDEKIETSSEFKREGRLSRDDLRVSDKASSKDSSPLSSAIVRPMLTTTTTESTSTVHNLKISVPAKSTNASTERSIELKSSAKHDKIKSVVSKDGKESKKLSIKDRLGEKVKDKPSERRPTDHASGRSGSGKMPTASIR